MSKQSENAAVWKLQRPLASNVAGPPVLAQTREKEQVLELKWAPEHVTRVFGKESRIYVCAMYSHGGFYILEVLKDQGW